MTACGSTMAAERNPSSPPWRRGHESTGRERQPADLLTIAPLG